MKGVEMIISVENQSYWITHPRSARVINTRINQEPKRHERLTILERSPHAVPLRHMPGLHYILEMILRTDPDFARRCSAGISLMLIEGEARTIAKLRDPHPARKDMLTIRTRNLETSVIEYIGFQARLVVFEMDAETYELK